MVNFKIVKNVFIDHKIFFILFLIFLSGCSNSGERPKFSGLIVGNSVDQADAINVVKKGNTLTLDIQDKFDENKAIDNVILDIRHSGEHQIGGSWTVLFKNKEGSKIYCIDNGIKHTRFNSYSNIDTTAACNWDISKLNDLRIELINGDDKTPDDAFIFDASLYISYNNLNIKEKRSLRDRND